MPNSNALAVEMRSVVVTFLTKWVDSKLLTYKFSAHAETSQQNRNKVQVVFSKPTPAMPAPAAVAHFCFHLDETLQEVTGFTVESDPHFHALDEIRFDERVIDQVIKRKLLLKQQNLVNLNDEFTSTRVPAAIKAREEEKRERDRENMEEYLLDMFQRKDPYNDGRIAFADFRNALCDLQLPHVSQQQRQILFAFVDQDRDEMVEYASFVPIAGEVIDTLTNRMHDEKELRAECKAEETKCETDPMHDAEEAYQMLVAREIDHTLQKLNKLIQNQEQIAAGSGASAAAGVVSSDSTVSIGIQEEQHEEANEGELAQTAEGALVDGAAQEKSNVYITVRQLRGFLESPQLLISKGEANLMLGLVETSPSGQIPCAQLGELYPRVRSLIFQYQHRCFADRIEKYLQRQFQNYESGNLRGSAEHLRFKLKQKEIKMVVKDMKKLLLTPYQLMQVVALCEESRDVNHAVCYQACIPQMVRYLRDQVNIDTVIEKASILHGTQESSPKHFCIPSEDVLKRTCMESFEALDQRKLGVLSTDDFFVSLKKISAAHAIQLDAENEMTRLNVLADPNGSGRVNYLYFLHLLYPLLRFLQQERHVVVGREGAQKQDAKVCDRDEGAKDAK